jgi:succinyl-CoA synthetase alpha subunit
VFVPATLAAKAIEEAIEAEIPLIVSVAEGMPVHDCLRVITFPHMVNCRFKKC